MYIHTTQQHETVNVCEFRLHPHFGSRRKQKQGYSVQRYVEALLELTKIQIIS
jgi:hypothetical protein